MQRRGGGKFFVFFSVPSAIVVYGMGLLSQRHEHWMQVQSHPFVTRVLGTFRGTGLWWAVSCWITWCPLLVRCGAAQFWFVDPVLARSLTFIVVFGIMAGNVLKDIFRCVSGGWDGAGEAVCRVLLVALTGV